MFFHPSLIHNVNLHKYDHIKKKLFFYIPKDKNRYRLSISKENDIHGNPNIYKLDFSLYRLTKNITGFLMESSSYRDKNGKQLMETKNFNAISEFLDKAMEETNSFYSDIYGNGCINPDNIHKNTVDIYFLGKYIVFQNKIETKDENIYLNELGKEFRHLFYKKYLNPLHLICKYFAWYNYQQNMCVDIEW